MYSIAQLKPGVAVTVDGQPFIVTKSEFSKQARQGGNNKTTMRNLITGALINRTWSGSEQGEPADLTKSKCQYLYSDGSVAYFMQNETYEQFELPIVMIAEQKDMLLENSEVNVLFFEDRAIGVELQPKIVLKVVETPPGVKGDTAQGGTKPAKLETGITVQVPLFINEGELVRINTEERSYVERA